METLTSTWPRDPTDLCDFDEKRNKPPPAWNSQCGLNSSPPAGLMWTQQLSPHIQRNKQLRDALLQKEEELVELQEENNKLREFLTSSFVRNLQQEVQKLTADGRNKLKRNLTRPSQVCSHQFSKQISKRVCRNLTAKFCSQSSETRSEPNLDLWVLRTLGLKDRDTIDTSSDSSPEKNFRGSVCGAAFTSSSSCQYSSSSSSLGSPVSLSTSAPLQTFCQRPAAEPGFRCLYDEREDPAQVTQNWTPGDFRAAGPTGYPESLEALIRSCDESRSFQSDGPETGSNQLQALESNPDKQSWSWSPLPETWTPSERVLLPPTSSTGLNTKRSWMGSGGSVGLSAEPLRQMDVAFSMSLSPSSSVKTHSFPQGQAFIRRDSRGCWNFTWVPRQEP